MIRYILKRLAGSFLALYLIVTFSFFMIRLAPGGPFDQERALPPDILKNIEAKYHLNEPLVIQYGRYIKNVFFHFDLGPSYKYPARDVNEFIAEAFPVTLELGCYAMIIAIFIGVLSGIIAALRQNTSWDYSAMGLALLGVSIPSFVLAPLLQLFFGLKLKWFAVAGWDSWDEKILPSVTLGVLFAASIARLTRGGMLEMTRQDFIRTARAKGLKERIVVTRHMLKGGLLPLVTYLGPATAFAIFGGSLVVERIFDIPGIGRHFINSALNRDYTMSLGLVIFLSWMVLLFNLLVDILYTYLDPRIKYD